jgi:hypothetical protein
MPNKSIRDYINLIESVQQEGVAEAYTPSAGELARDLIKMPDSDFSKKYGMSKQQANHYYSSSKLKEQGVAEEQLEETSPEAIAKINQITRK